MSYEVELKYAVANMPELLAKLESLGFHFGRPVEEQDTFYQHPAKDYAASDECLRIRLRAGRYTITYKGPKLDRESKTRHEIELPLTDLAETGRQWGELLQAIGFRASAELKKTRRKAEFTDSGRKYELTLDHIDGLGDFIEIETIAEERQLDEAQQCVKSLATSFDLSEPITTSYLELSQAAKNQNNTRPM